MRYSSSNAEIHDEHIQFLRQATISTYHMSGNRTVLWHMAHPLGQEVDNDTAVEGSKA